MTDLLIVGGGPAGMMAGLLFARAGARVRVIEKHRDFLRDFRGDTVHPSTMDVFGQLGMLDRFLNRPHQRLQRAELRIAGRDMIVGDLSHIASATRFIALMPQWDFLDFLREEANRFPGFSLTMGVPVDRAIEEDGRISGVRLQSGEIVRARLVIAADGRRSFVRRERLLPLHDLGSPIDVFWFELPKRTAEQGALQIAVERGRILVRIDRGKYWQCAFVIPKGQGPAFRSAGIAAVRSEIEAVDSRLGSPSEDLTSFDQLNLLEVSLDRLSRWHRSGLLAIGDAAHAMSPMGGVGINLAIQDAVAAANALAGPMVEGRSVDDLLGEVQKRRMLPTRIVQAAQRIAQERILGQVIGPGPRLTRAPLLIRLLDRVPLLRRISGRMIGLGVRRERVRSPNAYD